MPLFQNRKPDYRGVMNAFWIEPAKRDVMGYALTDSYLKAGDKVYPGTPIKTDPLGTDVANGKKTAVICKYAVVEAVANDKKALTVREGHFIQAGDKVAISGAQTLTELTVASVSGDKEIVLSAANNSIKAGDVLVEVVTTGSGQSAVTAVKSIPNRIVCAVAEIDNLDKTCSAAHDGIVLENVVNYPVEYLNKDTFPGSVLLKGCPKLMFTVQ